MEATSLTLQRGSARGRLEPCLRMFADVRANEGPDALLLAANIFCLLASHYVLKTARESLILSEANTEVKSYATGAQALILLAAVPLYGTVASRVGRTHLIISDPYLRLIAALVILANVVDTTGEYLLGRLIVANALGDINDGTAGGFSNYSLQNTARHALFRPTSRRPRSRRNRRSTACAGGWAHAAR